MAGKDIYCNESQWIRLHDQSGQLMDALKRAVIG